MISLEKMGPGMKGIVREIIGGRTAVRRLMELGIVPGTMIEVIQNYMRGPIIVRVRGMDMAIGRGVASKIIVDEVY